MHMHTRRAGWEHTDTHVHTCIYTYLDLVVNADGMHAYMHPCIDAYSELVEDANGNSMHTYITCGQC